MARRRHAAIHNNLPGRLLDAYSFPSRHHRRLALNASDECLFRGIFRRMLSALFMSVSTRSRRSDGGIERWALIQRSSLMASKAKGKAELDATKSHRKILVNEIVSQSARILAASDAERLTLVQSEGSGLKRRVSLLLSDLEANPGQRSVTLCAAWWTLNVAEKAS